MTSEIAKTKDACTESMRALRQRKGSVQHPVQPLSRHLAQEQQEIMDALQGLW